jgi:hypothetical protein
MRLGELLSVCKAGEHWRAAGFEGFPAFMADLGAKYKRGKTQLWAYLNAHEALSALVAPNVLERIGISKCLEIRRQLKKANGKPLTPELIEMAQQQSVTTKELRAALCTAFSVVDDQPTGTWFDCDGFYVTPEERKEFIAAVKLTMKLLGIQPHVPEHIQRKEIFFAWLREFSGTHAADVYGGASINTPAKLLTSGQQTQTGNTQPEV